MSLHSMQHHSGVRTSMDNISSSSFASLREDLSMNASLLDKNIIPYMTEDELIEMIKNNHSYELSKQDIEYLCLQRRRQSIDLHPNTDPIPKNHHPSTPSFKVMILGDESESNGKFQFFDTLIGNTSKIPYPITTVQLQNNPDCFFQLWIPYCNDQYANLRLLYYEYTHIFVLFFNISQRDSFNHLKDELLPEVASFIEHLQGKETCIPPILLVGYQSESREINAVKDLISFEEIIEVAQYYKCSKYIEIQSKEYEKHRDRHHSHVYEVMEHVSNMVSCLNEPSIHEQHDDYFRSMLTVPTPEISFHQMDKTFLITEFIEDVDYFYTIDGSHPKTSQCISLSKSPQHSLQSLKYEKPLVIHGSQKIHQIHVVGIERCKYTSDIASFTIPNESESVNGYFDVLSKCFRITNWKKDCVYYFTLDGSIPNEHLSFKSMEPIIQIGDSMSLGSGSAIGHGTTSAISSSSNSSTIGHSHFELQQHSTSLSIVAVEKGKLKSMIRTFSLPSTLQPPAVKYDAIDSTFTIDTVPGVIYRYTLDGSIPTHPFDSSHHDSTTFTYSRSVMLPKKESMKCIKVIAFPKLSFPSTCIEINAKPLMQEHLSSPSSQVKLNNTALKRMKSHSPNSTTTTTTTATPTTSNNSITTTTAATTTIHSSPSSSPPKTSYINNTLNNTTTTTTITTNNTIANTSTPQQHDVSSPYNLSSEGSKDSSNKVTTSQDTTFKNNNSTTKPTTSNRDSTTNRIHSPQRSNTTEDDDENTNKNTHRTNVSLNMLSTYHSPTSLPRQRQDNSLIMDGPLPSTNTMMMNSNTIMNPSMMSTSEIPPAQSVETVQRKDMSISTTIHSQSSLNEHDECNNKNDQQQLPQQYQQQQPPPNKQHHHTSQHSTQQCQQPSTRKFLKTSTTNDFQVQCKAEGSNVIFTFDRQVSVKRIRITTPGSRRGPQFYACYIPSQNTNSRGVRTKVGEGELQDIDSVQYLDLFTRESSSAIVCKELMCTFSPFEGQRSFKIVDMKIECNKYP
ncbi:hypothetical protein C9374_014556 [Naegleria lovaniensis]|uniref:Uncharacterized protein n=1 Tax=Naegleria lovaniensis TaxID=51637 RepID=A0AA88KPZ6_NAELO|nr:uncharacterized protein C9374_014556 [Naegleria lovaniensis]KAG2389156.1 hypothetical protein C9374_014556 [Naegleria lovaniensis]